MASIPARKHTAGRRSANPDIDIISNRYKIGHQEKTEMDHQHHKATAAATFWKSRDFNPVSGSFYNPDKEEYFHKQRQAIENMHASNSVDRLPSSIKNSEGMKRNILSSTQVSADPQLQNSTLRSSMERSQQERAAAMSSLSERRTMNRCTAERQKDTHSYGHGYNILNTKTFVGRNAASKAELRGPARKSLWDKLEDSVNN